MGELWYLHSHWQKAASGGVNSQYFWEAKHVNTVGSCGDRKLLGNEMQVLTFGSLVRMRWGKPSQEMTRAPTVSSALYLPISYRKFPQKYSFLLIFMFWTKYSYRIKGNIHKVPVLKVFACFSDLKRKSGEWNRSHRIILPWAFISLCSLAVLICTHTYCYVLSLKLNVSLSPSAKHPIMWLPQCMEQVLYCCMFRLKWPKYKNKYFFQHVNAAPFISWWLRHFHRLYFIQEVCIV